MATSDARFSAAEGWSHWPAPAKLNLFLHITGRRSDGYHLLQTVFRLLDFADTIHLRVRSDGRIHRHSGGLAGVAEADDLTVRAARLLQAQTGCKLGADIAIEKRIPAGGGFGGGSSDAATVLVALNHLWQTGLETAALARLGLALGADVPVFVHGQTAWAEGVGEVLTPLALPPAFYLLAFPDVHVPTARLFAAADLVRDAAPIGVADFLAGARPGNAFEPVLRRQEAAVEAMFRTLSAIGEPRLTGTGSGVFVEFASAEAAQAARAQLPEGLNVRLAQGTMASPLLMALGHTLGASPSG